MEQRLAKAVATARHKSNRKNNVKNSRVGNQSDYQTDLEGIGGEIAFCKTQNVYPDLSIEPRRSEDDNGDAIVNGLRFDVKTTKHSSGHLLVVPWKKDSADVYALMVGEFPSYRFAGTMPAEELCQENRLKDFGYGPSYAASQEELH